MNCLKVTLVYRNNKRRRDNYHVYSEKKGYLRDPGGEYNNTFAQITHSTSDSSSMQSSRKIAICRTVLRHQYDNTY